MGRAVRSLKDGGRQLNDRSLIQAGWDVVDSNADKIGTVEEVGQDYLLVRKGLIFTSDLYIPTSAVSSVEDGVVYLNVVKDEVESRGWGDRPSGDYREDEVVTTTQNVSGGSAYEDRDLSRTSRATTRDVSDDTMRVPVHEEELTAQKTAREAGAVRVDKDIVEEERTLDVPVTREEVQVRRQRVDRPADGTESAFTDGDTIRVPIVEEQVEVRKVPKVVEEIEIQKTAAQDTERVSDTVRREQVNVEEEGRVRPEGDRDLTDR